jgi:hypothetical protein
MWLGFETAARLCEYPQQPNAHALYFYYLEYWFLRYYTIQCFTSTRVTTQTFLQQVQWTRNHYQQFKVFSYMQKIYLWYIGTVCITVT